MSQFATLMPPSVQALNQLLGERRSPDRRLRFALGTSYLAHALLLTAAVLVIGTKGYRDFGDTPVSTGIVKVTPLYSPGAPPGPRPAAIPAPARPAEKKPDPEPEPPRAEVKPVPPPDDTDILRETKRAVPRPTPKTAPAPAAPTKAVKPEPDATARPGGGTLPGTRGAPGSPTGQLSGDPDGGLTSLLFSNRWYAARVQDIIYSNWGDPFYGQERPPGELTVLVRFVVERDGRIGLADVEKSSGNPAWDRSGLRAVENSKLPPLPPDYPGSRLIVHYEFRTDMAR